MGLALPILCPSSRCAEDSLLIGIVRADGTVSFVGKPVKVDETFVTEAHRGRTPESRFRFAQPCKQKGCRQWTGQACGIVQSLVREGCTESRSEALPECGIRDSCRWFAEEGAEACRLCDLVITEL